MATGAAEPPRCGVRPRYRCLHRPDGRGPRGRLRRRRGRLAGDTTRCAASTSTRTAPMSGATGVPRRAPQPRRCAAAGAPADASSTTTRFSLQRLRRGADARAGGAPRAAAERRRGDRRRTPSADDRQHADRDGASTARRALGRPAGIVARTWSSASSTPASGPSTRASPTRSTSPTARQDGRNAIAPCTVRRRRTGTASARPVSSGPAGLQQQAHRRPVVHRGPRPAPAVDPEGDYASARDHDGHGTHTASTAGGNRASIPSIFGRDLGVGTISGMAPRARIAAYKGCFGEAGCVVSDLVMRDRHRRRRRRRRHQLLDRFRHALGSLSTPTPSRSCSRATPACSSPPRRATPARVRRPSAPRPTAPGSPPSAPAPTAASSRTPSPSATATTVFGGSVTHGVGPAPARRRRRRTAPTAGSTRPTVGGAIVLCLRVTGIPGSRTAQACSPPAASA